MPSAPTPAPKGRKTKRPAINWTATMIQVMLEALVEQVRKGKRAESGFKKEVWTAVLPQIQAEVVQTVEDGSYYEIRSDQAANKLSDLKSLYSEFKRLLEQSGFGWDEEQGVVTAPDEVWDAYLKVCQYFVQFEALLYLVVGSSGSCKTSSCTSTSPTTA
jgi:hypothetical protein